MPTARTLLGKIKTYDFVSTINAKPPGRRSPGELPLTISPGNAWPFANVTRTIGATWLTVDNSISGRRVTRELDRGAEHHGYPHLIVSDNGAEFTSNVMLGWSKERGIEWHFIAPGKPMQNAFAKSFIGRLGDACLNEQIFMSYRHAGETIEAWRIDYNLRKPHTSLDGLTPIEFATRSRSDHK